VDTDWDVRNKNSNAYWWPEDGVTNEVALKGVNRNNIEAMTPSKIQSLLATTSDINGKYAKAADSNFSELTIWGPTEDADDVK